MPSARKISRICVGPPASAKPTAVPTNGAEHGVASKVANAPMTKLPISPLPSPPAWPAKLVMVDGSTISKKPQRLQANSATMTATAAMNTGCWNWMPQPTASPADFSAINPEASSSSEKMMPAAVARKLARTVAGGALPYLTRDISFNDSTGKTQGIRLRIRPPSSAKANMKTPVRIDDIWPAPTPAAMTALCSTARRPSTSVIVTGRPASVAPAGSSPVMAIVRIARRLLSARRRTGVPNAASGSASANTSGALNGSSDCASISSETCLPS